MNGVARWFVVRDLGASLGKTTYPALLKWFRLRGFGQGTRNDLPGFEEQGFIKGIDGSRVEFDYRGIYRDVVNSVTPQDVRWACDLLSRLSDQQWRDAFRAGGYNSEQTARYVSKLRRRSTGSRVHRRCSDPMRILVVEDEPAAATVLAKGLREHAYAVDVAPDGAAALEQVGINDYDLIVLDVLLPGINGLDLCSRLRADGVAVRF